MISERILDDIARVGSRLAVVGVEYSFPDPLIAELRAGEIGLAEAADRILQEASWHGSAAGSLARLGGRVKAAAGRAARRQGEADLCDG